MLLADFLSDVVRQPHRVGFAGGPGFVAPATAEAAWAEWDRFVEEQIEQGSQTVYDQAISLKELAELVNLSPYHFLRVFKREVGVPPHTYQLHRRITAAKHLLATEMPIGQVAAETGFVDQSHLTHRFRRSVGVTPKQYAENSNFLQDRLPR